MRYSPPGAAASQSYLQPELLLHVAKETGCDALHPGYGFLAERAEFARRCAEEGILFIGPTAEVIALMGDKSAARRTVTDLKVPVVPGSSEAFVDESQAAGAANTIGFPLLLKARAGGGGRGIRLVEEKTDFATRFAPGFGDGHLYIER